MNKDSIVLSAMAKPLLEWYDRQARVLPWRESPEPYRVWISEIMLQQTRVEAVKPYFERFICALPNIAALANAETDYLLKLWEGLGYYSRVRNLQKAAQVVMEQYGGQLPASYEELQKLPGIGAYTAGAIASIAYGIRVPAVDGNVLRVTARVLASRADVSRADVKKHIEQCLIEILPARVGDFNQALMELGAMVCLPNGIARCDACPIHSVCQGHLQGIEMQLPVKAAKKPRKKEERTVFLLLCNGKVALHRRKETGLLAGMWELPNAEGALNKDQSAEWLAQYGMTAIKMDKLTDAKHVFTHIEWHMTGYAAWVQDCAVIADWIWVDKKALQEKFALPSAFQAYFKLLENIL